MKEFKDLGLKAELLESLKHMGFHNMTEVQELSIPVVMQNKDVIVRSKTGSGKTGAFLVPIFQMTSRINHPQALIIVPTRELALQVSKVAEKLGHYAHINTVVVYGGASINIQMQGIARGADIIVGTPGRILDLIERRSLSLSRIRFLVLDEADLMLDMGFIEDIERIISLAPRERQTMLFSATMPREIIDISKKYMKHDTQKLTVGKEEELTVSTIVHNYFIANGRFKFAALLSYIEKFQPKKGIIFTSTQRESDFVHRFLRTHGMDAIVMHGGLTQAMRERSLHAFRDHARFLISTNLASRGLDIPDISDIINFDAPDEPKVYVHRVGRSARMGKDGRAFTLFGFEQKDLMHATERIANIKLHHLDLDTLKYKDITLPPAQHHGRGGPRFQGRPQRDHHYGGNRGSGGGNRDNDRRGRYRGRGGRYGGS